jgi:hypothetical protein
MATTTARDVGNVFRPSDYDDLPGLRKAFSAAYATFLRHPEYDLTVADDGTLEQRSVIDSVRASRSSDTRRGDRSFIPEVSASFRGKPCSLKRHFGPGCLRQIIGYAEKLAANDPDRFIWVRDWKKTAKRGRAGSDGVYGATQIKRCLWWLESAQLLIPARRLRNGRTMTGWIVAAHEDVSELNDGRCRLQASSNFTISPRSRGQQLDRYVGAESEAQGTIQGTMESPLRDYPRDYGIDSEGLSNGGNSLANRELEGSIERNIPPNPVNPVIIEPSHPGNSQKATATPTDFSSMTRCTREEKPRQDQSAVISSPIHRVQESTTITPAAAPSDLRSCLAAISDSKFDYKSLRRYDHKAELQSCCIEALSEQTGEWKDPAHRMVRAMEFMRERYGFDVPKGWVPVMQQLRRRTQPPQAAQSNRPIETRESAVAALRKEELDMWIKYEDYDDRHGTYDGFIPSNAKAFRRSQLREATDPSSKAELHRLESEALEARLNPAPAQSLDDEQF